MGGGRVGSATRQVICCGAADNTVACKKGLIGGFFLFFCPKQVSDATEGLEPGRGGQGAEGRDETFIPIMTMLRRWLEPESSLERDIDCTC